MAIHGNDEVATPFVRRLALRNYKSIAQCQVSLAPLTVLVGPNGAGKSNLLDSLRFVSESLRNSLEFALRERGGINEVRRCSKGHPTHFGIRLEMTLRKGASAVYAFQIAASRDGGFTVQREECRVVRGVLPAEEDYYRVAEGALQEASLDLQSAVEPDRLYLSAVSAISQFREVYDKLTRMGFYNFNPDRIRDLQDPDPADVLARDGRNIASILKRLETEDAGVKARIEEYVQAIVPGVKNASVRHLGPKETIEFKQQVPGDENPWPFPAASMSDGTLRALGVLVAIFQGVARRKKPVPLVGIEEPEVALHPGATSVLASAIIEATEKTQVLITSHSPDLLDNPGIRSESILAVVSQEGQTIIGTVDDASRKALREGLYTPGELLRLQQIEPKVPRGPPMRQLDLFADQEPQ